jgi:hypothetical protein
MFFLRELLTLLQLSPRKGLIEGFEMAELCEMSTGSGNRTFHGVASELAITQVLKPHCCRMSSPSLVGCAERVCIRERVTAAWCSCVSFALQVDRQWCLEDHNRPRNQFL